MWEKKEKAIHKNQGKTKWSLVDFKQFEGMAKVLEEAVKQGKYPAHNWKNGLDAIEIVESCMRHLIDIQEALVSKDYSKLIDPEFGLSHVAHLQARTMMLNFETEKLLRCQEQETKV